jgi:pyrroline-5-carboxylate reductase
MKIGFWGAGEMAEGILSAIPLKKGVIMAEKRAERAAELKRKYHVSVTSSVVEVAKKADLIFLAVRPVDVAAVAQEVKGFIKPGAVVVSIAAGKSLAFLRRSFGPKVSLIRVMPNLALKAKEGMCAIAPARGVSPDAVKEVEKILGAAGKTVVLAERFFDAVTALSGSGPAYFAYMEKMMAEGAMALGLKADVARLLAEQTMYGTAKYLRESGMDLNKFIAGVCTKGGTTAAGMEHLSKPPFGAAVAKTLAAAAKRSQELGR